MFSYILKKGEEFFIFCESLCAHWFRTIPCDSLVCGVCGDRLMVDLFSLSGSARLF